MTFAVSIMTLKNLFIVKLQLHLDAMINHWKPLWDDEWLNLIPRLPVGWVIVLTAS